MPADTTPILLVASADPILLLSVETALHGLPVRTQVVRTAQEALESLAAADAPAVFLPDVRLSSMTRNFIDKVRDRLALRPIPVLLLADGVPKEWLGQLDAKLEVDLIPTNSDPEYIRLRISKMLSNPSSKNGSQKVQTGAAAAAEQDGVTGLLNRRSMLARLAIETDRAQRMETPLCLILFEMDDTDHWTELLGPMGCDDLRVQMAGRVRSMLRSYDLLGRIDRDKFIALLPGCSTEGAVVLAERIRSGVFVEPFRVDGTSVRLTACFAVTGSEGQPPAEILEELENTLRMAQDSGPETIECAEGCPPASPPAFLSPLKIGDLPAW